MQNYLLAAKNTCSLTFSTCINLARIFSRILAKYYISRFFSTLFHYCSRRNKPNEGETSFFTAFRKVGSLSESLCNLFKNLNLWFDSCIYSVKNTLYHLLSSVQKKATDQGDYGTDKGVGGERSLSRKASKVASSSASSSISDRGSDITDAKTDNNDELASAQVE